MVSEDKYSWQNSDWQISKNKTYVYKFDHLDTLYEDFGSYDATQGWEHTTRWFYEYDAIGNNLNHTQQCLIQITGWDNEYKFDYTYDEFSNNLTEHQYNWVNSWEINQVLFYDLTYDNLSNVETEILRQWYAGSNDTTNSTLGKYTYYDDGMMQSDTGGWWDSEYENGNWRMTNIWNYEYDGIGNIASKFSQVWSDSTNGWLNQQWYQTQYDTENRFSV